MPRPAHPAASRTLTRTPPSARIRRAAYQPAPPSPLLTHSAAGAPCSRPHTHTHAAFRPYLPRRLSARAAITSATGWARHCSRRLTPRSPHRPAVTRTGRRRRRVRSRKKMAVRRPDLSGIEPVRQPGSPYLPSAEPPRTSGPDKAPAGRWMRGYPTATGFSRHPARHDGVWTGPVLAAPGLARPQGWCFEGIGPRAARPMCSSARAEAGASHERTPSPSPLCRVLHCVTHTRLVRRVE